MSIADNLRRVQDRMAAAAESAGRDPAQIKLVGVTKYVGAAEASELINAGCRDLGESRPQELRSKHDALQRANGLTNVSLQRADGSTNFGLQRAGASPPPAIRWHLIGHLQRNKVRRTLPLVSLIHSVDSERLLAAINNTQAEIAGGSGPPCDVLLEVNTSGETAKHGLAPDEVEPLLVAAPQFPYVQINGLMTMAALDGGPDMAARNFATLRELRDRWKPNAPDCVALRELSMGMSGDFEIAIREGATIVRVGSALWD